MKINESLTSILEDENIGDAAKSAITDFKDQFSNLVKDLHVFVKYAVNLTNGNAYTNKLVENGKPISTDAQKAIDALKSVSLNLKDYSLEKDSVLQAAHKTVTAQVSSLDGWDEEPVKRLCRRKLRVRPQQFYNLI